MGKYIDMGSFYPLGEHCAKMDVKCRLIRDGESYAWRAKTWSWMMMVVHVR